MSGEPASKFGLLKGLQQSSKAVNSGDNTVKAVSSYPAAVDFAAASEVRFTNYLDAQISRRLQVHVAQLKARKPKGGERVSIKSVLHQALLEYLERNGG